MSNDVQIKEGPAINTDKFKKTVLNGVFNAIAYPLAAVGVVLAQVFGGIFSIAFGAFVLFLQIGIVAIIFMWVLPLILHL